MKAMIFAAGLGTRLRPLTNDRPKALVEFKGVTLLEHTINTLKGVGVDEIVVNVHHFADLVIAFLKSKDFGVRIVLSDERDALLDTGGGLLKAAPLLSDGPFFIHNVDILSDIDLDDMMRCHRESGALATIGVRAVEAERYFMRNNEALLCGWGNDATGEQIIARPSSHLTKIGFTGVHLLEPSFFKYIQPGKAISIIDAYLKAAAVERVNCYPCDAYQWMDVGTPEALLSAKNVF